MAESTAQYNSLTGNEAEENDESLRVTTSRFVSLLSDWMTSSPTRLYAWIQDSLASEGDDDDNDDTSESTSTEGGGGNRQQVRMIFSTYRMDSLARRNSDFENDDETKVTSGRALFTLFKCFVATGIMFLPSGFRSAGLMSGVLVLLIVGPLSLYGMLLLLLTRDYVAQNNNEQTPLLTRPPQDGTTSEGVPTRNRKVNSYALLGLFTLGPYGQRIIELAILCSQLGFCCVYISFTGNSISHVVSLYATEKGAWPLWKYMLGAIPLILPLSLIRHLKHFAIPNLIANVFVVITVIYMIVIAVTRGVDGPDDGGVINDWSCDVGNLKDTVCFWYNPSTFPMFLGSAVYVFEGITMVIPIRESMKEPRKLPTLLLGVVPSVTLCFVLFGASSFYAYGQQTSAIALNNLPRESQLVTTIMFVFVALFMFPLMIFPAARIVEARLFKAQRRSGYKWYKNLIRTILVSLCLCVSIFAGAKVDKLVAVIGGLFCVPLALVFPPLLYLKSGCAKSFWTGRFPATCLLCIGVCAALLSTYTSVSTFSD